ncbi:acyl carrier protein [Streptomyces stramineus]
MAQHEAAVERILRSIVELTARYLSHDPETITGETSFFDLGADSLQMISVLRELEQEYSVKVAMRELFEETGTPRQLAVLIAGRMAGPVTAGPTAPAVIVSEPRSRTRCRRRTGRSPARCRCRTGRPRTRRRPSPGPGAGPRRSTPPAPSWRTSPRNCTR